MKYEQKFKDFVEKYISEYLYDVFSDEYAYSIVWCEEPAKYDGDNFACAIDIETTYLHFKMIIYPHLQDLFNENHISNVKESINHEMCHLLTEPISLCASNLLEGKFITREIIKEITERQTQKISYSIMRLNNCIDEKDREIKKLKNHSGRSGKSH